MLIAIVNDNEKRKHYFIRLALRNFNEFMQKSHITNKWRKYSKVAAQICKKASKDCWFSNFDKFRAADKTYRIARRLTSS